MEWRGEYGSLADWDGVIALPGFSLGVRCRGNYVAAIEFLPPMAAKAGGTPLAAEALRQLAEWSRDPAFRFDLPLLVSGTDFRRRVWAAISRIPLGQTRTYGELARELASSPRAVGQACGDNPFPVIVPCHRVVAASGPGGFAHGGVPLEVKHWLLAREGVV